MLASAVKVNSDEYINDTGTQYRKEIDILGVTVISRAFGNKILLVQVYSSD